MADPIRIELTVKEYASRWRVTERTRVDVDLKHAVETIKTPGGGVRVVHHAEPSGVQVFDLSEEAGEG